MLGKISPATGRELESQGRRPFSLRIQICAGGVLLSWLRYAVSWVPLIGPAQAQHQASSVAPRLADSARRLCLHMRGVLRRRPQPLALPPVVCGQGSKGEIWQRNGGARRRSDSLSLPGDGPGLTPLPSGRAGPRLGERVVLHPQQHQRGCARVRHSAPLSLPPSPWAFLEEDLAWVDDLVIVIHGRVHPCSVHHVVPPRGMVVLAW